MFIGIRDASRQLSSLINRVVHTQEPVVLTSRGRPKAVLLSYEAYQDITGNPDIEQVLARARRLRAEFEARYGPLTQDVVAMVREERAQQQATTLDLEVPS
jgi:prevent-host-death family protein